jgi:alkaline phosphatase
MRDNYSDIAKEMIYKSDLDVIMGCGHPRFGNSGEVDLNPAYNFVGGEDTWKDITDADGANGFKFIETKADFEKLAEGSMELPKKVLGVPQARATLQEGRIQGNPQEVHPETFNKNVPDLATMSVGAIRVLHQNPKGFYLMIEGGAVDWANHGNLKGRMIEEEMDFNKAVQAVVDWVNKNSNWDETLLIVTADHETGFIWGASDHFAPLAFNGTGKVPGMVYNANHHTNSLVPVFAKGAGSDLLKKYAAGFDPIRGQFLDNTDIFNVMFAALGNPTPEKKWPKTKSSQKPAACTTQPVK